MAGAWHFLTRYVRPTSSLNHHGLYDASFEQRFGFFLEGPLPFKSGPFQNSEDPSRLLVRRKQKDCSDRPPIFCRIAHFLGNPILDVDSLDFTRWQNRSGSTSTSDSGPARARLVSAARAATREQRNKGDIRNAKELHMRNA